MPQRILVVDDDPMILRLLQLNLEMEGYEVVSAVNGREALAAVAEQPPDLMVCDVMMPGMDGLEVVSRLRREPVGDTLPIVMLSAKAQELDVQRGRGAGADEYVTKPFDPEELLGVIGRLLSSGRKAPEQDR